jgi:hypothetical protein
MRDVTLAIVNRLLADTNVATKVATRVYRAELPGDPTLPAIVVSKIDDMRPNDTNEPYGRARIQVTIFATNDGLADDISGMVADSLNQVVNCYLTGVIIVGIEDAGTRSDNNPDVGIWMYHRDFMVNYL